jgi:hypothetical protein
MKRMRLNRQWGETPRKRQQAMIEVYALEVYAGVEVCALEVYAGAQAQAGDDRGLSVLSFGFFMRTPSASLSACVSNVLK